jgi:hypothetical protein
MLLHAVNFLEAEHFHELCSRSLSKRKRHSNCFSRAILWSRPNRVYLQTVPSCTKQNSPSLIFCKVRIPLPQESI